MKKSKYVLLLLVVFILIAIGIKTLIPIGNKSISESKIFEDTIKLNSIVSKNAVEDIIIKDTTHNKTVKQLEINENANELNLRFFDELTGYAVVPEYVEIKQREDGKSNRSISNNQISRNGSVLKRVANGKYDITVSAKGYLPMQTFFDLNDQTMNIHFNLVPMNPPKELSISHIQSLHQNDAMVLVGSIVDDFTGIPIQDVEVYTADGIERTYSNKSGFFKLIIPLANDEQLAELRGTIYFKLNNYITEVRENFDMWPNGDYIFKIKMIGGSGINRESVIQNREVNRVVLHQNEE